MPFEFINPESLGAPRGYSNGVLTAAGGRLLFIAGQIAWDETQRSSSRISLESSIGPWQT
jgi:enamine deaminase RidA (YjgF/YER057c/UK114 family)